MADDEMNSDIESSHEEDSDTDLFNRELEENFYRLLLLQQMINLQSLQRSPRMIQHDCPLSGKDYTKWMLSSHHPLNLYEQTRLTRPTFDGLLERLHSNGFYAKKEKGVTRKEALLMFLMCMARDKRMRDLTDIFQHSSSTCSRVIRDVREAICKMGAHVIVPRNQNTVHHMIRCRRHLYPYFKGCVGAIDGTHVKSWARSEVQQQYRNRKGVVSQNVLAVVDHDMRFVFVLAGFGGSAHDAMLLQATIDNPNYAFPNPPRDKYYAVDSAYRDMPGFLAPFCCHKYHLSAFRGRGGHYNSVKELFNHRHAQVHNVVERTFEVLKSRFHFLTGPMFQYDARSQAEFVLACCIINNLIKDNNPTDEIFAKFADNDEDDVDVVIDGDMNRNDPMEVNQSQAGITQMEQLRMHIVNQMLEGLQR